MIAYKLFRELKNGGITPLFINKTKVLQLGKIIEAEDHPTKGYSHRPGWHCAKTPEAPHLMINKQDKRVWYKVDIEDFYEFTRPKHQGGVWLIANQMKILEKI